MKYRNKPPKETGSRRESRVTLNTMGSRIFRYFAVFSVVIMLILWLLQILFMQTFYQGMKRIELEKTARIIEEGYGKASLYDTIINVTGRSDVYVQIQCGGMILFETTSGNPGDRMNRFASTYDSELLKEKLKSENLDHTVVKLTSQKREGSYQAMIYASILDSELSDLQLTDGLDQYFGTDTNTYLFIYAPLTAVGTTIDILAKMLIIVTCISILIGLIMSIIISRRLSRPINNITASAAQLAKGNYSIHFDGSGYTETEELAATLNYASEELSKSDKLQKDLVANVSHDLKTPLTMVKSYAEMIRDLSGDNPEKRNKHLQVIINEADRLNGLVNDLTMLSKMQARVDTLQPENVDIAYLARETIESFSLHQEQDGFNFSIETEGSTEAMADEKKLRQVFSNLIGNAVRYSGDNKNIEIKIKGRKHSVYCEVTDHGQGIAADDLESIWDRYYQSSSNHSRTSKGSGLGLSIVKQIFILHQARYGVRSIEGQGSTFWFDLPRMIPDSKGKERSR